MEIIELSAIPGALEETKRKAKKSKKHYKKETSKDAAIFLLALLPILRLIILSRKS